MTGTDRNGSGNGPRVAGSLRRELLALLVVYLAVGLPALLVAWGFGP